MMAVESSFSQDLVRKNREGSEPKKKLKKTRSIRLSKVPSLKPSSRRSKSRFSWISVDFSSDDTSSANGLSDSSSSHLEATSCCDAKKDNYQGGNETDDAISVGSSSYGSSVNRQPAINQAIRIKKMLKNSGSSRSFRRRAISKSVQYSADGSPNYLKATSSSEWRKVHPQASPQHSESNFNSSDQSNAYSSKSMSVSSSQKSLQSMARTPSMRSVKIVINRNRPSSKCTQVSEDLKVDKATCSSTLKDLKFREHVELHAGQTEAERISKMKVCPYHHCSLNGRSHGPAPPPKRPLYKKGRSLKSQKSTKSVSESTSGVKFSGGRQKEFHISQMKSKVESSSEDGGISIRILTPAENDKDRGFSIEIYAKSIARFSIKAGGESKDAAVVEVFPGESSYYEERQQESVNQMMSSSPQMQDITETTYDQKGTNVECCCDETEERKLSLVSAEVGSDEAIASSICD